MTAEVAPKPSPVSFPGLSEAIIEAAGHAGIGVTVTVLDSEGPRNVFVTDQAVHILGYPREELLQGDLMTRIADCDRERVVGLLAQFIAGEAIPLANELMIVRKNGELASVHVASSSIQLDGLAGFVCFLTDITERRRADEALRLSNDRFRTLIESAPDAVAIWDGEKILYANPVASRVFGRERFDEIPHRAWVEMLSPEDIALVAARSNALLAGRKVPPFELRAQRPDGRPITLDITSVPIEYDGHAAILVFARDSTRRRDLETKLARAEKLAAVGTLAAGVAHEINNPLMYAMLNLDAIGKSIPGAVADPTMSTRMTKWIGDARGGAQRVQAIVRQLGTLARNEPDAQSAIDIEQVADLALDTVRHQFRDGTEVHKDYRAARAVLGSPGELQQVLVNLLVNAAQSFGEDESSPRRITITLRNEGSRVLVEVADTGTGIAPEIVGRVFDPFFTTKRGTGTGLGLAICHGIVLAMGGEITVITALGRGTTFTINLPAATGITADVLGSSRSGPARDAIERRTRILIVDDEAALARALSNALREDHDSELANNGAAALALLVAGERFDVILCDLLMPEMNGVDFYRELARTHAEYVPRLIFMTGNVCAAGTLEFLGETGAPWFEKPFAIDALQLAIRKIAERSPGNG